LNEDNTGMDEEPLENAHFAFSSSNRWMMASVFIEVSEK